MPKILVDENLSPGLAEYLRTSGVDAVHVREVGLKGKLDPEIVIWARDNGRVILTNDLGYSWQAAIG